MAEALIKPRLLSHGTVECQDMATTRRFFEEFLGVEVIRPLPEAQYLWKGGPWTVVCVNVDGDPKDQGVENRFVLAVGSEAEVEKAHQRALETKESFGILEVGELKKDGHTTRFVVQDLNKCWWEIANETMADYDAIFARGDIAA